MNHGFLQSRSLSSVNQAKDNFYLPFMLCTNVLWVPADAISQPL